MAQIKSTLKKQRREKYHNLPSSVSLKPTSNSLSMEKEKTISFKTNNQGSITLIHNPVFYIQTKHIDIQYHHI